ncbi:MAG: hypothetical protein IKC34_03270 [Clostridia bacterium]|nr:hypothetical protein [Clostridia bacterium]
MGEENFTSAKQNGVRILREDVSSSLVSIKHEYLRIGEYLHTSTNKNPP